MDAKKYDRCGEYYGDVARGGLVGRVPGNRGQLGSYSGKDICPACNASFDKWWNGEAVQGVGSGAGLHMDSAAMQREILAVLEFDKHNGKPTKEIALDIAYMFAQWRNGNEG